MKNSHKILSNLLLGISILVLCFPSLGQSVIRLDNSNSVISNEMSILPDKNYSFERIRTDQSLNFKSTNILALKDSDVFWVKIKVFNPSSYSEKYMVEFKPMTDNTLYYFDYNKNNWLTYSNGLMIPNRQRNIWFMPCILAPKDTSTLFIKTNIEVLRNSKYPVEGTIWLEKESYIISNEHFIELATLITIFTCLLFVLYNAYIFFSFRDKTFLYYLIVQLGGIIFILGDQFYFNVLFQNRFCVANSASRGFILFQDLNCLACDLGIGLILFGYVQITSIYLNLPKYFSKVDRILKYSLYSYLIVSIIYDYLLFSKVILQEMGSPILPTIPLISTLALIFYSAILSFKQQYKLARYFLFTNGLTIFLMLMGSIAYLFVEVVRTTDHAIFAKIAIIVQAFFLAISLVQRVLLIKEELKEKQLEAQELTFQNTLQKAQNDLLQEKLEANQRELASNALYLSQKNEMLLDLKSNMQSLSQKLPDTAIEEIKNIKSVIQNNLYLDGDWERFRIHFEQVHPDFFKNLLKENPTLTQNEIRLCAYFHLNLSTKEIAAMLNIDPASVRKAKMRLNKKIRL